MSANGNILSGISERNGLSVANGMEGRAHGVITRKRTTIYRTEESVIDLVLTSCDMVNSLVSIHIDENKDKILTSITRTKKGIIKKESDHNSIITNFNIPWERKDKKVMLEI